MIRDINKIQIGDVLYEPSIMYNKVIEHKIIDIFFEKYVEDFKTVVIVKSAGLGLQHKYSSDILRWFTTEYEAKKH